MAFERYTKMLLDLARGECIRQPVETYQIVLAFFFRFEVLEVGKESWILKLPVVFLFSPNMT